jgi:hypothetical protein
MIHRSSRIGFGLFALLLLAVSLVACGSDSTREASEVSGISSGDRVESKETDTAFPPPVIVTVSEPDEQNSFILSEITPKPVESDPVITKSDTLPPTAVPQETETPVQIAEPTVTLTPMPTFTPPPTPESSSGEHLWLSRPVPQGSTVWTDKAYPYGTTRGGTLRPHHGVEFNVPANTEIMAVAGGIIKVAGDDGVRLLGDAPDFYGNLVVIEHDFFLNGQPVYTLYGHLSEILVEEGQEVSAREVIGLSGSSGVADGAHLHFEVRVGNNDYQSTRNPLLWLYPFPDRGVVSGIVSWPGGGLADEVPLTLRRLDAPSPYRATTTYASQGVNADDGFQENFAFDDVDAGFYELSAGAEGSKAKITFWVYPYQTSFVEIELGS